MRLPVSGWALALSLLLASPLSAQLPEVRSALSGVYTEEQAAAGEEVFKNICGNCHNASYPLWGPKFQGMWMSGGSLWKLYEFLSQRMPYGNGGGLEPVQYRAATAYILKLNGYPAGTTEIPETPLEIAYINLDKPSTANSTAEDAPAR
jgi:mono/diheme cytochrome c family protein